MRRIKVGKTEVELYTGADALKAIAVSVMFAASAAPTAAQVPAGRFDTGSRLVAQSVVSVEMGRCAVRQDRRRAAALVLEPARGPQERAIVDALKPALVRCLAGARSATLDPGYLRGGIAEALLDENGGALLTNAKAQPAVSPVRLQGGAVEPVVAVMGCAAAAQPAAAAAMLESPAESPAEATAFRALAPSLQACAPATGEVRFSPARIRPATAIALYRRVAAKTGGAE